MKTTINLCSKCLGEYMKKGLVDKAIRIESNKECDFCDKFGTITIVKLLR